MTTYRNTFHKPKHMSVGDYGPAEFTVDVAPTEYKGFSIYRRLPECFDCVINGEVIGMYAGINGAKSFIDTFWAKQNAAAETAA